MTSRVQLRVNSANYIAVPGYFTAPGDSATLNLLLELCRLHYGGGTCIYYPLTLELRRTPSS
ncbi:MAG: hypothetical protein RMI45_00940 [Ignisphaera sp.]|nr:hypothetical protein [Ignisphaera sp.]MDW8084792.1 hypothetical protein [Ignisphaera sp.]